MASPVHKESVPPNAAQTQPSPALTKQELKANFLKELPTLQKLSDSWEKWTLATLVGGFLTLGATWLIGLIGQAYYFYKENELGKKATASTEGATKTPSLSEMIKEGRHYEEVSRAETLLAQEAANNPGIKPEDREAEYDELITTLTQSHETGILISDLSDDFRSRLPKSLEIFWDRTDYLDSREAAIARALKRDPFYCAVKQVKAAKQDLLDFQNQIYGIKT